MVVNCDIQFENNPDGVFYAGQVINGKVTLTADKVKQVKGVALKITGKACTRWSESNGKDKSNTTYWAEVDYINTVTYLMKPNASDQTVVIAPGIHTFSFACHIPQNCPSSFEGYRGDIRYILKINLMRPWKFDQTFTRAFTVLSIKNLNYDSPVLKLPVRNDVTKVFCCGACNSDPLEMQVQLLQTGFVPWSEIGNISPPVYMEASHMPKGQLTKDAEHDFGEKSFSPKYPVFDLSSQTSPQTCLPRQDGDEIDGNIVPTAINDPDKTTWL